ncbi:MAG: helix-turn-helix domain-containing protein [Sphingomonadales bacterium]|jgi:DNA-binding HxlR family transcriptional regulator
MALAAEVLGDKWTLLILREAFYGVQRFDDMLKDLGAPRAMLTDRLNKLIKHNLMTKEPYQEPGDRVRYCYVLTEAGQALAPMFIALTEWGEDHIIEAEAPVKVVDKDTGKPLHISLCNEKGQPVATSKATLVQRS